MRSPGDRAIQAGASAGMFTASTVSQAHAPCGTYPDDWLHHARAGLRDRVTNGIPGMAWALHRFNPRGKANAAALSAMEERMRSRKP